MIGIIDYKAGNSNSVQNACEKLGIASVLISNRTEIEAVDHIILPGVGSAQETMNSLREMNLIESLEKSVIVNKIPFLGICVGLQVLFEFSEEENAECLGWLKGHVKKFDEALVRVPQMGWNNITWSKSSALKDNVGDDAYFYFVNSYYAVPDNKEDILAVTDYSGQFTSMVEHNNIFASQFHIEKSGNAGLQILKNFSRVGGVR